MHGGVFHRRKGAARLACSLHQLVELNWTGYKNAGFYRLMLCVCWRGICGPEVWKTREYLWTRTLLFFSRVMLEENEGVWRHTVVFNDPALLQGLEANILWCLPVALCV